MPTRGRLTTLGSDSSTNKSLRVWSIVRYLKPLNNPTYVTKFITKDSTFLN